MDQKFVSGLGNIYVNEILFFCKISPIKKINKLKIKDIKNILINTKRVLKKAIIFGGSSIKNFLIVLEKKVIFSNISMFTVKTVLNVQVIIAGGIIKKIVISNRASFFVLIVRNNKVDPINTDIYIVLQICQIQFQQFEG